MSLIEEPHTATLPPTAEVAPASLHGEMGSGLAASAEQVSRETLVNRDGVRFRDFRRNLTPKYHLVWLHLLAGHAALLVIAAVLVAGDYYVPGVWFLSVPLGSVLFGYTIAYILLFFHEAAHYNLLPSRRWNDRLANLCIGVFTGQDIRSYRRIHFDHHRHLGTPRDTERTYFDPLTVRFLLQALVGIKMLQVLRNRDRSLRGDSAAPASGDAPRSCLGTWLVLGLLLNLTVVVGAVWLGCWPLAVAWALGVLGWYPFFAALRQLLEHRDEDAAPDVDYRLVPHGAVTRLFGDGPLASTLGGAGFNRHLLHHWDPQLSYTRLAELEAFLMETPLAEHLRRQQTTYGQAFRRQFRFRRTSGRRP